MPEIDPTSDKYRLVILAQEYKAMIDLINSRTLDTEDIEYINGQRTVWHNSIIEELNRLNIPFEDRHHAMQIAYQLAQWHRPREEYDGF